MMIHEITEKVGRHKKRKRIGRGRGSGHGKTAGRGTKGMGARSGNSNHSEGGRIEMWKRFPKRGFTNSPFMKHFAVVNLSALDKHFNDGEEVTPETLKKVGLIRGTDLPVKVLGYGELTKKLTITAGAYSKNASDKITAAGGSATVAE